MADLPPLPPTDLTEQLRAYTAAAGQHLELWRDLVVEATSRLYHDPLLHRQATTVAALICADRDGQFARAWSTRDESLARWASAVALVLAERPELLTGEPPTGAQPVEVIAARLSPIIDPLQPPSAVRDAAAAVLTALALQGYEVTRRADRFAHLDHDGRASVRIPTRGRCRGCGGEVSRGWSSGRGEVLILPWHHDEPDAPHRNDRIDVVEWP